MRHYLNKREDLERIRSGEKKAIIIRNEDFQTGDILVFQEFDSMSTPIDQFDCIITHVSNEQIGLKKRYCVLSIRLM